MAAVITASSVLCAGGRGTDQVWATVRAGVSCIGSSHVIGKDSQPIQMGLVPADELQPLPESFDTLNLPSRARRMLQLAAPVLQSVGAALGGGPIVALIGMPKLIDTEEPWLADFLSHLGALAEVSLDMDQSRVVPMGRAAALMCLETALQLLEHNPGATVLVGGVDTYLDLLVLSELDAENRLLGQAVMDGFIPGEGAAFLVLNDSGAASTSGNGLPVHVLGASSELDPGHRYGTEPALGEGLANAMHKLRGALASTPDPVATVFAGFNGESFDGKGWGVARLRHRDFFSAESVIQHPADCIGDTGAASGAILTALAATSLATRTRSGPALIWAASDWDPRACALLSMSA
jgi:3-oxoacyl-[acyl-carrier-protein] synthase I